MKCLPFSLRLNKHSCLSFSYILSSSPLMFFCLALMFFCLACSNLSKSSTYQGAPTWTLFQIQYHKCWMEGDNHFLQTGRYVVTGAIFSCLWICWGFCQLVSSACWNSSQSQLYWSAYRSLVWGQPSTGLLRLHSILLSWSLTKTLNRISYWPWDVHWQ